MEQTILTTQVEDHFLNPMDLENPKTTISLSRLKAEVYWKQHRYLNLYWEEKNAKIRQKLGAMPFARIRNHCGIVQDHAELLTVSHTIKTSGNIDQHKI